MLHQAPTASMSPFTERPGLGQHKMSWSKYHTSTTQVTFLHILTTLILSSSQKMPCSIPQDYRPINLCNFFYKIVAKSLVERVKNHLPHLIHHAQHAFVKGRHITTNVIITQEIAHTFQLASQKHKGFIHKLDLAKAFDRIEWPFIVQALRRQGFHGHFIDLIRTCMESATFSVLINGQPFGVSDKVVHHPHNCSYWPSTSFPFFFSKPSRTINSQALNQDQNAHLSTLSFLPTT